MHDLIEAVTYLVETLHEEKEAKTKYEGYDWGYFGHQYCEARERATDEFITALNAHIDERINSHD